MALKHKFCQKEGLFLLSNNLLSKRQKSLKGTRWTVSAIAQWAVLKITLRPLRRISESSTRNNHLSLAKLLRSGWIFHLVNWHLQQQLPHSSSYTRGRIPFWRIPSNAFQNYTHNQLQDCCSQLLHTISRKQAEDSWKKNILRTKQGSSPI